MLQVQTYRPKDADAYSGELIDLREYSAAEVLEVPNDPRPYHVAASIFGFFGDVIEWKTEDGMPVRYFRHVDEWVRMKSRGQGFFELQFRRVAGRPMHLLGGIA